LKRIIAIMVVFTTSLTGCGTFGAQPVIGNAPITTVPVASPLPVPQIAAANLVNISDMPGFDTNPSSAIAPATVDIGKYYPGATAEWQLIIHNGDGLKNKLLQITTEAGETVAAIPLKVVLANSGLLDIISIQSTILKLDTKGKYIPDTDKVEHLEAVAYDNNNKLLTIKGFKPLEIRIVKITYKTISSFNIYYREPSTLKDDFDYPPAETGTWVSFDKPILLLRPMENGVITVSFTIPSDTKIDKGKWLFWIGVMEKELGESVQVATRVELCQRILVTMR